MQCQFKLIVTWAVTGLVEEELSSLCSLLDRHTLSPKYWLRPRPNPGLRLSALYLITEQPFYFHLQVMVGPSPSLSSMATSDYERIAQRLTRYLNALVPSTTTVRLLATYRVTGPESQLRAVNSLQT